MKESCPSPRSIQRIVGGKEIDIKRVPSIVAIIIKFSVYRTKFTAAANIVSKYWALTAAHVTRDISSNVIKGGFVFLRGSKTYWNKVGNDTHTDHLITEYYEHPRYGVSEQFDCDIALLKVRERFGHRYEKPVSIAGAGYRYRRDIAALVAGWGTTDFTKATSVDHLRGVTVNILESRICREAYSKTPEHFTENMICGGTLEGGKDSCTGDSGGPLLQSGILIGLVSYGQECGLKEYPGVYTKVAVFQKWLHELEVKIGEKFGIKYVHNIQGRLARSKCS